MLSKIKVQDFAALKKSKQADLHDTINRFLPGLTPELKGVVAGLCIEYVVKSGGDPDIFVDEQLVDSEEDFS
jgi:hypothetical protein